MASTRIENVRIAGVASAAPGRARQIFENEYFSREELAKVSASTGVLERHLVEEGTCTSDLCQAAGERLLERLGWERETVDALIFVSQTPDYVLPATACALHGRLGLAPECAAFDVNLGCSGYVYGLWLAGSLLNGGARRVLLLVGDTISRIVSPQDRSVALLFGDAGTATGVERAEGAPPMYFELGTNGAGEAHLIVPAGGFRKRGSAENGLRTEREGGNIRSDQDLFMEGSEIFAFTMSTVPAVCKAVMKAAGWSAEGVDGFVMHQANRFMLQHLAKLMKLPKEKVVLALEKHGNTSSASIPMAMTTVLGEKLQGEKARLVLAGFGVGFSWAAAAIECGPMEMPPLIAYGV